MTIYEKRIWFVLHLLFVMLLFAGVLSSLILITIAERLPYPELEAAGHYYVTYLDTFLIVPGSFGSLITGFWLAWRSNWGLTRHYWVLTKLVATLLLILDGSQLIRRWAILSISRSLVEHGNLSFLHTAAYLHTRALMQIAFGASLAVVLFLVVLSVYKPWRTLRKTKPNTEPRVTSSPEGS
jgi:uncharacterized membrane protein